MKLHNVLEQVNPIEINSFINIIDGIRSKEPTYKMLIDDIFENRFNSTDSDDSQKMSEVFRLIEEDYQDRLNLEFRKPTSQIDIWIDIISREGSSIMNFGWFSALYDKELRRIENTVEDLKNQWESETWNIEPGRKRDYDIYLACLKSAYQKDRRKEHKDELTVEEQAILNTLSRALGLSIKELKSLNYMVIPIYIMDINDIVDELKAKGIIFHSERTNRIYVPDEFVRILRKVRGKSVANRYIRRLLRSLNNAQIDSIAYNHNIPLSLERAVKEKAIVNDGIPLRSILMSDIHERGTGQIEKKKFVIDFIEQSLKIDLPNKGGHLEEIIENLVEYFTDLELNDRKPIKHEEYNRLLHDLKDYDHSLEITLKDVFELEEEDILRSEFMMDYNVRALDILELIEEAKLKEFADLHNIKIQGIITNDILESYRNFEDIYEEAVEAAAVDDNAEEREMAI